MTRTSKHACISCLKGLYMTFESYPSQCYVIYCWLHHVFGGTQYDIVHLARMGVIQGKKARYMYFLSATQMKVKV